MEKCVLTSVSIHFHYIKLNVLSYFLQNQLKELLHIPPHVLLPEDEAQKTQYSNSEEEEVDNQIKDLLKRIKRVS